ncbi:MAG TPA: monovalent cation/H+ antiporter complex subunit F [Crenalkalicoccus sp.]|nr:monovalent cation/H+ antiporter complex subunit F [Crenalkalicoccus sp.]
MNAWSLALLALLPALLPPIGLALRGATGTRLVAAQCASAIAVWALALMSFAFDQPMLADLPLALGLLSLPGTLLFTVFLERWL